MRASCRAAFGLAASLLLAAHGCASEAPAESVPPGPTSTGITHVELIAPDWLPKEQAIRVLFVGNSLTSSNALPAVVQALAAAGGKRLEYMEHAPGGANLDDHWTPAQEKEVLAKERWDFVVLQQGPSTQPDSRIQLTAAAKRWSEAAREGKIKTALYGVWPYRRQRNGFDLCTRSYREAAKESGSAFFPAGEAWRAALAESPPLEVYGMDGLHPSYLGTYLAALVITEQIGGVDPIGLPNRFKLSTGRTYEIPVTDARRLQTIAQEANRKHAFTAAVPSR